MTVLLLHNRYRTHGGEERAVDGIEAILRERLGEQVVRLERDSAALGRARAARAMLRGGLAPDDVGAAVRSTGATIVHAHNLNPSFGWRALAAACEAGARTVLHLHNYRLVCAVGTCFTHGEDCTRCHARDTRPGVRLRCRGSAPEAVVYAAALARWQPAVVEHVDAFAVPSAFARDRLRELGAPIGDRVTVVPHAVDAVVERSRASEGAHALVASRLSPEKGVEIAIEACARAGRRLVIAGDGPLEEELRARAREAGGDVRFEGVVDAARLAELRAEAALAIVPSRSAETFGLAAAEAMAAGLPVVASRVGALPELVDEQDLVPPGDAGVLAAVLERRWGDDDAGDRALERIRELASGDAAAARLRELYDAALEGRTLPQTANT